MYLKSNLIFFLAKKPYSNSRGQGARICGNGDYRPQTDKSSDQCFACSTLRVKGQVRSPTQAQLNMQEAVPLVNKFCAKSGGILKNQFSHRGEAKSTRLSKLFIQT
jgi:hypothetical protein